MITGLGFVAPSPLGAALAGQQRLPPQPPPEITAFEVPPGAPTWGFEVLDFSIEKDLPRIKSFLDRTSALALLAGRLALADAGRLAPAPSSLPHTGTEKTPPPSPLAPGEGESAAEIGCSYGTMLGCLEAMGIFWNKIKTSNPRFAQPLPFTHGYANSPSSLLCIEYALRGPAATFSGERLAGVEALLFAFDQIRAGAGEIILAGASESLTPAAYNHLLATGQLSRSGNWDDGLVPGEGAAMLVLESLESAQRRKARIYAEVEAVELRPFSPEGGADPFPSADEEHQAVIFVPAQSASGGHVRSPALPAGVPAFATELYSGDMLSVSPVLATTVAAGLLGGKYSVENLPFSGQSGKPAVRAARATVMGCEAGGNLGTITLAACQATGDK